MQVTKTDIDGVFLITPQVFEDDRGCFFESYNQKVFNEAIGMPVHFVQDNESQSTFGVLRGFAFQKGDHSQAKLVRVTAGEVLDVVVDMRESSPTFGKMVMHKLSSENKAQVFIPRGCAHAFVAMSDFAIFHYKVDNDYSQQAQSGFRFDDPDIAVPWPFEKGQLKVSDKDLSWPSFKDTYKFK